MVKPLYAVSMFMKVCCTVYMSIGSIFKASNAQFVIMKTFLFVSRTDAILKFVPLSLLTALNLSLHSGETVMDSVSKAFCS